MQVACPQCQAPVCAENINIQEMMALCSACSSVFSIARERQKQKRRRLRQPKALQVSQDDQSLRLAFRSHFHLRRSENFRAAAVMSAVFPLISLLMWSLYFGGEELPLVVPLLFMVLGSGAIYSLATMAYNKTRIVMDEARLRVSRGPLPSFSAVRDLDLADVESMGAAEAASPQPGDYEGPLYHVWAGRTDGGRTVVVGDRPEAEAFFTARRLEDELYPAAADGLAQTAADAEAALRLEDDDESAAKDSRMV